jgi:hypothetical protein
VGLVKILIGEDFAILNVAKTAYKETFVARNRAKAYRIARYKDWVPTMFSRNIEKKRFW